MVPKIVTHLMVMDNLPQPVCGITAVFSAFTFFFHPMVLAMIACIRYFFIVPWTTRARFLTLPRLRVAFGTIFSFAVVFSVLPYCGVGVYKYSKYHGVCFADWEPDNRIFRSIFYIFVIGVAFPVLTFSYTKLFLVLRAHNRDMKAVIQKNQFSFRNPQFNKIRSESARPAEPDDGDEKRDVSQQFEMKVIKEGEESATEKRTTTSTQTKSRSFSAIEFTEFSKLRGQQQQRQENVTTNTALSCSGSNSGYWETKLGGTHQQVKAKITTIDFLKITKKTEKRIYRTMTLSTSSTAKSSKSYEAEHQQQQLDQIYRTKSNATSLTAAIALDSCTGDYHPCDDNDSESDASVCTLNEVTTTTTTTTVTKRKKKSHRVVFKNSENTLSKNNADNKDEKNSLEDERNDSFSRSEKNSKSCNRYTNALTTIPPVTDFQSPSDKIIKITETSSSKRNRTKLSKQEYQMTKLMIFIFLAYIVCWFPAAIVNVAALIDTCNVPKIWYCVIVTMVELKSCLNPLIYGIGNRQYRAKIKVFFKKYFGFMTRYWH